MTKLSFHHDDVASEHQRWIDSIADENSGLGGISIADVIGVHFLIVDMFYGKQEGLGGIGPKDIGLLSSAVSRQHTGFADFEKWQTTEEKAATLLYGIVLNHPFHDANKRTGFLTTLYYLQKNGKYPKISSKQFEDFVVTVADKSFRNMAKYKKEFKDHDDGDIRYIAHYIRSVTRNIDKKDYTITYRELDRILKRFGFCLSNPYRNYIDIVKLTEDGTDNRVGQIGFPSWTKQVTRQNLKATRQATNLTVLNGVDSQVFFKDIDPISQLLAKYHDPLKSLADR